MGLRADINKTIEDITYFRNYFIHFIRPRIPQLCMYLRMKTEHGFTVNEDFRHHVMCSYTVIKKSNLQKVIGRCQKMTWKILSVKISKQWKETGDTWKRKEIKYKFKKNLKKEERILPQQQNCLCKQKNSLEKKYQICLAVRWDRRPKTIFEVIPLKNNSETLQHFRETCILKFQKQSRISEMQKC